MKNFTICLRLLSLTCSLNFMNYEAKARCCGGTAVCSFTQGGSSANFTYNMNINCCYDWGKAKCKPCANNTTEALVKECIEAVSSFDPQNVYIREIHCTPWWYCQHGTPPKK